MYILSTKYSTTGSSYLQEPKLSDNKILATASSQRADL